MLNQELFDRNVEHLILMRRYGDAAQTLIEKASKQHRSLLATILRKNLKDELELKREITRHVTELYSLSKSSIEDMVGAEIDFQANSLRKAVGDWYRVNSVDRRKFAEEFTKTPLRLARESQELQTLHKGFQGISDGAYNRANLLIRRGLAEGKTQSEILSQVLTNSKLTENQAKTLLITNMTYADSLLKSKFLEANKEVLRGVVFTAILDSRTSKICSTYNGLYQSLDNLKVKPPLHWRCRSTLVPVLKSKAELVKEKGVGVDQEELDKVDDTDLPAALPPQEDLATWLRRQPMQKKLEHLGSEEAVALLESGTLSMADFNKNKGPLGLSALRVKDNLQTFFFGGQQKGKTSELYLGVSRPFQLIRSEKHQKDLRDLLVQDSQNALQSLSLMDYKGTTLAGKRSVRKRANNEFDPRNSSFDPFTGEVKSTLLYDPDYTLYRERVDYMKNSKLLDSNQKEFIEKFADSLEDRISTNQQTAVVENLRILFERYEKDKVPWEDFVSTMRAEMNYSTINASQLLDKRSRKQSELFLGFKGDPKDPSVQIQGNKVTLEELFREKLKYQRYSDNWQAQEGRSLARNMFYSKGAPWRLYFSSRHTESKELVDKLINSVAKRTIRDVFYKDDPVGFYLKYGKPPDKWSKILLQTVKKKFEFKTLKQLGEEGVIDFVTRTIREEYRSIIDLEFLYNRRRRKVIDALISKPLRPIEGDAINVLAKMAELIAEGRTTDYDSLAIALGKNFYENWNNAYTRLTGGDIEDYHREGSRILELFRSQGKLRVNARATVRRSVNDLDTGRPAGFFKDTVSREVQILDPAMLKLQDYNRRIELSNRFGVERPENRYYVVPFKKTYVDASGNQTRVPVVTRSAFGNFDEKQLDGDFSDMLNWTMGVKFKVDPEFAGFMDDLVRFKDSRGQAGYYDDLNVFREEIIRRGDQGYGLMEAIRYYLSTGKEFSAHARIDGRGRVYYNGYLTPTGGEVIRPFLNSAKAYSMTPEGLHQLKIQLGAVIGPGTEALTTKGRLDIFDRHEKSLLKIGELISAKTQRERRLREFLEDPFVQHLEGEELAKVARFALEYYRVYKHTGGDVSNPKKLATYFTQLMGEADASASGLQVIALSTGNRGAALTSNTFPTTKKNRVYDLVAQDTVADPRFQQLMKETGLDLTWEDLGKASKLTNSLL